MPFCRSQGYGQTRPGAVSQRASPSARCFRRCSFQGSRSCSRETRPGCRVRACAIFMETRMNKDSFLKSALIGGVALGVLSALPVLGAVNCLCCAWVIGGGMLAAHLYVKDSPTPVTLGTGVLLGLLAGVVGAVVDTLFTIPLHMALRGSALVT